MNELTKTEKRILEHDPVSAATKALQRSRYKENTIRAYRASLAAFSAWLVNEGREISDSSIADYLADLFHGNPAKGIKPKAVITIEQVLKSVRVAYAEADLDCPIGKQTRMTIQGIRKDENRHKRDCGRGQVQGIGWSQADTVAAVAANGGGSLSGLRDAALVALASDCLLRVSEAVAVKVSAIEIQEDGSGVLTVPPFKQDDEERALYIGAATMGRLSAWTKAADITDGYLFRRIRRGGHIQDNAMTDRAAREIIRKRAADAGIEGRVSGHSLRVGAAQSLAAAGAGLVEMQQAGRWQSPSMPARYARNQLASRGAVAKLRHSKS